MKHVALFVVAAYVMLFTLLMWPVAYVAFFDFKDPLDVPALNEFLKMFKEWSYWLFIVVVVLCQTGLLLIPVKLARGRPISKRSVFWPIITAGLLASLLLFGTGVALYEALSKNPFNFSFFGAAKHEEYYFWFVIGCCAIFWIGWGIVFCRLSSGQEPKSVVMRQCSYLLNGSAVALFVAVPCHILARQRTECCAGLYTFIGLAFGIAVMLLSFGPGIYFLYAARWRKLHPEKD